MFCEVNADVLVSAYTAADVHGITAALPQPPIPATTTLRIPPDGDPLQSPALSPRCPRWQGNATAMARPNQALRETIRHLAVTRRSQRLALREERLALREERLALREERLATAPTAESAWRSSFAVRADGSWRSVATARRWTSSRASGSAMASSSQVRSRADRKAHILSVPSLPRLEAGPWLPSADLRDI